MKKVAVSWWSEGMILVVLLLLPSICGDTAVFFEQLIMFCNVVLLHNLILEYGVGKQRKMRSKANDGCTILAGSNYQKYMMTLDHTAFTF